MLLAPNRIPAVPVRSVTTGLPEEQNCTPALLNVSVQSKPDTHHWALFRKSTNYWSPTDTTGLNFSCFKLPAGCMGLGDWKHSSNQSQTLQLEYLHTNEVITSFHPSSPCTSASLCPIRVLQKKSFFRLLDFYLSYLFLERCKIHLCSAVLRKYTRPLKYQAEMLIEK